MQTHRDNPARNQRSRASWVTDLPSELQGDTSSSAPADKKEAKAEKKAAKKEKKAAKKEKKAEKKDEMKKDEPK